MGSRKAKDDENLDFSKVEPYFSDSTFDWSIPNFISLLSERKSVFSDVCCSRGPISHKFVLSAGPLTKDLKCLEVGLHLVVKGTNGDQDEDNVRGKVVLIRYAFTLVIYGGAELEGDLEGVVMMREGESILKNFPVEADKKWNDTSYLPEGKLWLKVKVLEIHNFVHGVNPPKSLAPLDFQPAALFMKGWGPNNLSVLVETIPFHCSRDLMEQRCPEFAAAHPDDINLIRHPVGWRVDPDVFLAMLEYAHYGGFQDQSVILKKHLHAHALAKSYNFKKFAKAIDEVMLNKVQVSNCWQMLGTALQHERIQLFQKLAAFVLFHIHDVKKTELYQSIMQTPQLNQQLTKLLHVLEIDYKKKTQN